MGHLLDGISSSARVLPLLDGATLEIASSAGAYLFDPAGRGYVDTALGFGGIILGHADPTVTRAAVSAIENGALPAFSHAGEEAAAAILAERLAPLDAVIFTSSGSEAVHLACRVARTVTGRPLVAKMAAGFDGWLDEIAFGNITSTEASFADGARPSNGQTTLLRFNDFADVDRLFAENPGIAAIVYEPMLANAGCLMPADGYLAHVQQVARAHGALLIADEVLMGFRLHAGLTSHLFGLDPDIATFGKAVGNGVPVAGVIGRRDVMQAFHAAKGLRGGTYSGNPMACAAVIATQARLGEVSYPELTARGDALRRFIVQAFADRGVAVSTSGYGTVFSIWFGDAPPADYADAVAKVDAARSTALHLALRRAGVLVMPSPYGRVYLSFAHDDAVVGRMQTAFVAAAAEMAA